MTCSGQPALIQYGLKMYMNKNKQKHLRPCPILSHSCSCSCLPFSIFIVRKGFISNKIEDVGCFKRLLDDLDIYLALFSFEWLLCPDYSKVLHSHYCRALFLLPHGGYLPKQSGRRQSYLQITNPRTPLGSLALIFRLQGLPCPRSV